MSTNGRIASLNRKHEELDADIEREVSAPSSDQIAISDLKKRKLAIKDEIVRLEV